MIIAPLLMYGTEGIFIFTKRFSGFFNIPIVALFVVGIFNKTVSGKAARMAVLLLAILYGSLVWIFKVELNFVHIMCMLFIFDVVAMLLLGKFWKRDTPYIESTGNKTNIELVHWKYTNFWIGTIILGSLLLYGLLSPIGLASHTENPTLLIIIFMVLELVLGTIKIRKARYEKK